jgi:hypothetical protein
LGSALLEESSAATLVWLVTAMEHARSTGQTKVVGYLEVGLPRFHGLLTFKPQHLLSF